jgi:hypothetical protein
MIKFLNFVKKTCTLDKKEKKSEKQFLGTIFFFSMLLILFSQMSSNLPN